MIKQTVIRYNEQFENYFGLNAGLTYMIIATTLFSGSLFIIRLNRDIPSFEILYIRSFFMFFINDYLEQLFTDEKKSQTQISYKQQDLLILRGFFGFLGFGFYALAIHTIQLSEASILFMTNPIWSGVIGYFILNENYTLKEISSILLALIGATFIIRPAFLFNQESSNPNHLLGTVYALLAAFMNSCTVIIMKVIGDQSSAFKQLQYFSIVSLITCPLLLCFQGQPKIISMNEFMQMFFNAVMNLSAQYIRLRGVQLEKAARATTMGYFGVILNFLYDYFFFQESISLLSIFGFLFIFIGAFNLIYKKSK